MTKYKEIVDQLRTDIYEGVFPALSKLPEQTALSNDFKPREWRSKSAKSTEARRPDFHQKRSWHLCQFSDLPGQINEYIGLVNRYGGRHKVQSKIISFNVRFPEANEMDYLSLRENEPVYDIVRLRMLITNPLNWSTRSCPSKQFPILIWRSLNTRSIDISLIPYISK